MFPLDNVAEHRCSSWLGTRPRTWGSEGSRRAIYSLPSGYIWHCERHRGSLHVCSTIIFYILPCLILTPAEETRSWTNSSEEPSLVVGWVWIVVNLWKLTSLWKYQCFCEDRTCVKTKSVHMIKKSLINVSQVIPHIHKSLLPPKGQGPMLTTYHH